MSEQLLPCPFCGGEAKTMQHTNADGSHSFHKVYCGRCGVSKSGRKLKEAIAKWNTRHERTCEGCAHVTERTDMPFVCETCNRAWNDHYAKVEQ